MKELEEFTKFLDKYTPPQGGCLLCMDGNCKYYLVERFTDGSGSTFFVVNRNLWSEYADCYDETWRVIFSRTV